MIPYERLLYTTDASLTCAKTSVVEVDQQEGRVALRQTVMFPGGGGQPADRGTVGTEDGILNVSQVKHEGDQLWHWLDGPLPRVGAEVTQHIDWERRLLLSRTHSALHVVCGVIYRVFTAQTTGASMEPGAGRLDFAASGLTASYISQLQQAIDHEIQRAHPIRVLFLPRKEADRDPALIRARADLIPRSVDPLRVIDIVGLDRQADGGTHVATTAEIGRVVVTKIENKGAENKRVRIIVDDNTQC